MVVSNTITDLNMRNVQICDKVFSNLSLRFPVLKNLTMTCYEWVQSSGNQVYRHNFTINMPHTSLDKLTLEAYWDSWEWEDDYTSAVVKVSILGGDKKKIKYYTIALDEDEEYDTVECKAKIYNEGMKNEKCANYHFCFKSIKKINVEE